MLLASDPGGSPSILFITQRAAQLDERKILQLANTFTRHGEILSDVLESLRLSAARDCTVPSLTKSAEAISLVTFSMSHQS
jgi:hypothetical protein